MTQRNLSFVKRMPSFPNDAKLEVHMLNNLRVVKWTIESKRDWHTNIFRHVDNLTFLQLWLSHFLQFKNG